MLIIYTANTLFGIAFIFYKKLSIVIQHNFEEHECITIFLIYKHLAVI